MSVQMDTVDVSRVVLGSVCIFGVCVCVCEATQAIQGGMPVSFNQLYR